MDSDDNDEDKTKKSAKKRDRVALKGLTEQILDAWLNDEVEIIFENEEVEAEIPETDVANPKLTESEKCRMFTRADLEDFFRPKRTKQ